MSEWKAPDKIWANPDKWDDRPPSRDAFRPWEYAEYIRADLVEAAVERALEGAADVAEVLDDPAPAIRALDPAQFVDGEK